MESNSHLISRASHSKYKPKVRGFLSLPAELRNQIYAYCFESEFRCEIAAKGRQFKERKRPTVKLYSNVLQPNPQAFRPKHYGGEKSSITVRISRRLGKYNIVQGLQTNWAESLHAIHLVCKQVYAETLTFLYHKTVFVFDAPNRITNFLSVVPKSKLEFITKLHLHYTSYGCPTWDKDRIWQDKHHKSWVRACSSASRTLVGLHELKIWMLINNGALRFNLRQNWVLPLLQFRRIARSSPNITNTSQSGEVTQRKRGLEVVEVKFRTQWSGFQFNGNQEVAKASEDLHRLFGNAISYAILGRKEESAMAKYNVAWDVKYKLWQYHLSYGKTGW
ncbi:hypothetical protein GQ44DRAFT_706032 [Phaeosphaeriaceae sp. PMI808]|nr:hypothetical protein GQ44DRAFT_706032 [Phaeosphaeriaceae sp. PMI808]